MTAEGWKALGSVLSGVATFLGVVGAGLYFILQNIRGFHIPNLSVSIACERRASPAAGNDWLAITVTLKKLDRGTLSLSLVDVKIGEAAPIPMWGAHLVTKGNDPLYRGIAKAGDLDWEPNNHEPLNLTPGEETQLSAVCQVEADAAHQVKIVIVAFQRGFDRYGQWQASAVSLPRERPVPIP
jgi:hypothetical protein